MARYITEDIVSLCDRVTTFCNELNKRLDKRDEQHHAHHQYDLPQAVQSFHPYPQPPHAQPPDPPDWQQPHRPYNWGTNADLTLRTSFPQPPQTDPIYTKLDHPLAAVTELESHMGATDQIFWHPSPSQQPNPGPPSIQPSWRHSEGPLYEHHIALYNEQQPVQASQPTWWKLGPPDELMYAAGQYHHQDNNLLPSCYGSAPDYERDPYRQPHSAPPEHLAYFGRSSYVQQQGSAAEYHSWVHQQLPPQPVLDQPSPQQQSFSGWSSTSHCHPAAPLPNDVVPHLNRQHVSLASEAMTKQSSSSHHLHICSSFSCDEAGTTSLTNKSVVLGRPVMLEETTSQSGLSTASAPQSIQTTHKDVEVVQVSSKPVAESLAPGAAESQPPILPLPPNARAHKPKGSPYYARNNYRGRGGGGSGNQRPVMKFTEDFDFMAMNEKLKKDEVWGHLGKSNRLQSKDKEGHGDGSDEEDREDEDDVELPNVEVKPIYNKEDFFESLSSNALDNDPNHGRTRYSKHKKKLDTETFGEYSRYRVGTGGLVAHWFPP